MSFSMYSYFQTSRPLPQLLVLPVRCIPGDYFLDQDQVLTKDGQSFQIILCAFIHFYNTDSDFSYSSKAL